MRSPRMPRTAFRRAAEVELAALARAVRGHGRRALARRRAERGPGGRVSGRHTDACSTCSRPSRRGVLAMSPRSPGARRDEHEPDVAVNARRDAHARVDDPQLERAGARRSRRADRGAPPGSPEPTSRSRARIRRGIRDLDSRAARDRTEHVRAALRRRARARRGARRPRVRGHRPEAAGRRDDLDRPRDRRAARTRRDACGISSTQRFYRLLGALLDDLSSLALT